MGYDIIVRAIIGNNELCSEYAIKQLLREFGVSQDQFHQYLLTDRLALDHVYTAVVIGDIIDLVQPVGE